MEKEKDLYGYLGPEASEAMKTGCVNVQKIEDIGLKKEEIESGGDCEEIEG